MNKKMTTPEVATPMGRCLNRDGTAFSRLRNALFVLFIGGIFAYGTGFAWYMLARFDLINLIRGLSADDAFYYFRSPATWPRGSSPPSTAASRAPMDITPSGCF